MPEEGGRAGLYATAYLCLLDGVAHIGAVAAYRNDSFYNDAFEAFARALELAKVTGKDAAFVEMVLRESVAVLLGRNADELRAAAAESHAAMKLGSSQAEHSLIGIAGSCARIARIAVIESVPGTKPNRMICG